MKTVNTEFLSNDECWGVQINGLKHCENCKWTGISACEGKKIVKTGYNSKYYKIGLYGIEPSVKITKEEYNKLLLK